MACRKACAPFPPASCKSLTGHYTRRFANRNERIRMMRLASTVAAITLLLALGGCACAPGFVGFDSRCAFSNVPSGQP